jgi:nucleoside-diphosphate-sugar epimerase
MSRSTGVDLVTGDGLAEALAGVRVIVDAASTPSPDEEAAIRYFTDATGNLLEAGTRAGVQRLVVVSIIGLDRFSTGYGAGKLVHERLVLAGPIPARILRASQFHEFVGQIVDWGRQGDVAYVPKMRTQLVAARTVAEALADLAAGTDTGQPAEIPEIAGPREENLAAMAALLLARRGEAVKVEEVSDPTVAESAAWEDGGILPGPHATLAGPTFEEWLDAGSR